MRPDLPRILLAVLVIAGTVLAVAAPVDAGGPTSVMLTNPGQGRAAAVYYSDPQYAELDEVLHGGGSSTSEETPPESRGASYFNVTWLVHDVSIWRTDQVMMQPDGPVWVATENVYGEESPAQSANWIQVDDPDGFRSLAASLGLIGPASAVTDTADTSDTSDTAGTALPEPEAAAPPATVVREEIRWFSLAGWRWAVPGLLVGLLAAALTRGRRIEPMTPRRELIEGPPERLTSPG